eukprot:GHRR01018118.1.p1 GENE.GHRR01018118.1~~GHRR01018118.1.p1  ORF type:complete len:1217 (+),score=567.02 GHRR01018118.1:272-3922(+)
MGVFLGAQDLYFAITDAHSNTISVYRTPGFKGKSLPLYTIDLARPSILGAGLFPGPPALAAPRVGAEAEEAAKKAAQEMADKAAAEAAAAEVKAEGAKGAASNDGVGNSTDAVTDGTAAGIAAAVAATAGTSSSSSTTLRIRRPGETWQPIDEDHDDDAGNNMMIPVIGVGSAYQQAGKGSSQGPNRFFASGTGQGQHEYEDIAGTAGELHSGGGVVMWQQAGGKLVMGGLPAPGVQYAAGEDSDDPDAAGVTTGQQAPHMGQVAGEHSLQLQYSERVVSVSWQNLSVKAPMEPQHCAAAILTTQRLMLVSGDLTILAATDASGGSVGLTHTITSYLWVGPALLYMTAAGQVLQLTWTGQTQHMASVAAQPAVLLAGALADSLLLLRHNPATGGYDVTSRAVGLLQPLVLGWTSLASCGLIPKGLNTARTALQALLETFDATHVTSGMLWSLIQGWCGDVAAALASHATDVEPSVQLAANSAAGKWSSVVSALRAEHNSSVFYPKPAPLGSQLHHKLLAAAAGAIMHGQFSAAQQCLEAAGEWETAMVLAVCSGDFGYLRSLAAGLQAGTATAAGGEDEAADIARLARALVAAYERSGRAFAAAALNGAARDWRLRALMADNSFFSNAADWSFGGPGKLPAMETSSFNAPAAFIQEGEVGPVPRAETHSLGAYLGNSDLILDEAAAAAAIGVEGADAAGLAARVPSGSTEPDFLANLDQLVALSSQKSVSAGAEGKGLSRVSDGAASSASSDGLAAVAGREAQNDPFAFSDDENDDSTSFGYTARKFKIHIKPKEETGGANPAAAGSTGASTPDLKNAASKLKLGPLGVGGGIKGAFGKGVKQSESVRSIDDGTAPPAVSDPLYDLSFLAKPLAAAGQQPSTSSAGLPPRVPSATASSSGGGGDAAFDALGSLAGLPSSSSGGGASSSAPGLGGPAMRPAARPAAMPVISDDDFLAALAPAIPESAKSKLLAAPLPPRPTPPVAAQQPKSSLSPAAPQRTLSGSKSVSFAGDSKASSVSPPGASSANAATAAVAAGDPPSLYLKGVSEMESASWDAAIDTFSRTLQALQSEPASASKTQRQAFAAQYLAAVMLLKAAGSGATAKEARLYRYVCALQLDDRHRLALVKEAVVRNKYVGNYRYAADQLTWLVTRSLGSAPMEVMAKLPEDIDECDRKGGSNTNIPADEKVEEWVSIVAAGISKQDVDEVVQPLLEASG